MAGLLARRVHAPRAHLLVGGAVDPDADFATVLGGPAAMAGHTAGYVPHLETMGMAESRRMTVQILRPAQIDGDGNLNTSRIGDPRPAGRPLPGRPRDRGRAHAAAATGRLPAGPLAARPARAKVACVTGSGRGWPHEPRTAGVTVLVTELAVIEFTGGVPVLRSVHPWAARSRCGRRPGSSWRRRRPVADADALGSRDNGRSPSSIPARSGPNELRRA